MIKGYLGIICPTNSKTNVTLETKSSLKPHVPSIVYLATGALEQEFRSRLNSNFGDSLTGLLYVHSIVVGTNL